MKSLFSIFAIIWFSFSAQAQAQSTGNIEIRITGLRNPKGKVSVNLFNQKDGFPDDPMKSFGWKTVSILPDTVVIVFEDLPYGTYAVSVLHDENGNGKMEKNFFGIPREGFAFSNNDTPRIKSPSFSDAMIELKSPRMVSNLKMLYY
ncbi:MAG: DUF2141 domain-containing protein [Bacteroidales bacterium]|nr:DUF2141 domain-containing protein [Bacteroidales bacterium]MCB8999375.1 DUF2141 domain-containing protein [Bacteroidales bacterium]MCB9013382.1 DUF2141 domain-containing protein [Bacteroidales bacterium]